MPRSIVPASVPLIDDAPLGFSDGAVVAGAALVAAGCLWPWLPVASVALGGAAALSVVVASALTGAAMSQRRLGALGAAVAVVLSITGLWAGRAKAGLAVPSRSYDEVRARVMSDPEPSLGGSRVDVSLDGHRWTMTVPFAQHGTSLRVGDELVVSGATSAFAVRRAFHDARHLAGRFRVRRIVSRRSTAFPYRQANWVRSVLLRSAAGFPDNQRTLFAGFVLGDVSAARPEITDDFRASGLSHLVVVSGQNLAFLLGGVAPLTALFGRRSLWVPAALRLLVVIAFVFVVRFEPSVLRAAVMASAMIVTRAIGRPQPLLRILMISVVVLLVVDPLLVRSVGFGLSVGAVGGIAAFAPWFANRLTRFGRLAGPLAVTIGAQLGTAPIALLVFDGVPTVSVLANLCAIPLAAPIMSWGVLAGLPAGLVGPHASTVVHLPTRLLLGFVGGVARTAATLPFGAWKVTDAALLVFVGALWFVAVRRAPFARPFVRQFAVSLSVVVALTLPTVRALLSRPKPVAASVPQSFGPGVVVFGQRSAGIWRGVDVLVLSHGVSAAATLERLRSERIGFVDLLVVVSGGKPQVSIVRAIRHRVAVGLVVSAVGIGAPPGVRWKRALPGLALRAGAVTVGVVDVRERRLEIVVS